MAARIRPATHDDAPRLGEVHVAAWRWAYRGLMPDDLLDSLRPEARAKAWEQWLSAENSSFAAWVAEVDGEVVGFASSAHPRDDDVPDDAVELIAIYLLEEHVGTGVGSALLEAAENDWRRTGAGLGVLWVLATNDRTRRFYERHGWVADGETKMDAVKEDTAVPVVRYVKVLA